MIDEIIHAISQDEVLQDMAITCSCLILGIIAMSVLKLIND